MASQGLDERRLQRLLEVGRTLVSELDRETLLSQLLEVARELTGARYAALGILDADREELEDFLTSGIDPETHRAIGELPRGRGILGELIREPRPMRMQDLTEHPRSFGFPPAHPPMRSFLGAPVLIRGEAWGNLYLTEKDDGDFDERDQESLVVLAQWAGIAIENSRLYGNAEARSEQLERAVAGLEATIAIARAVGGETDLGRVLELVVKRGRALVDARSLLILLTEGDELVVAAEAGEVSEEAMGVRLATPGTVLEELLARGHAERLSDVSSRVRLGLGELAVEAGSAMLVPLTFRAKTVGLLMALDRRGGDGEFSDEDERLMRAFATSAATAVATAQTIETEQLRLSLDAAEDERARWARELHDETLQGLGALQVGLTSALRAGRPEGVERAVEQAVEQIAGEIEKLQVLITELRPAALDELGLTPALASLVERARAVHGLPIDARIDLDYSAGRKPTRLEIDVESAAYRLVQEALTNIAKHAGARAVSVTVGEGDAEVSIEVRDDGRGFDPAQGRGGFGLIGMRERVKLAGGAVEVNSREGSGTVIRATLPARHRPEPGASGASEAGAA